MRAPISPTELPLRQVAEWEAQEACWLAWPDHPELWGDALPEVREAFVALVRGIVAPGPRPAARAEILVLDEAAEAAAAEALRGLDLRFHRQRYGDLWLRDTAPVFVEGPAGQRALCFEFNGWGGKYDLPGDSEIRAFVAARAGRSPVPLPLVCEGGALEVDGEGTCLTTRQCLLNPNRNPGWTEADVEAVLGPALGVERFIWLEEGLLNDHTDGHVDTLARFVAPGRVVCMAPAGSGDPNAEALIAIRDTLAASDDARGRRLEVIALPSPGRIEGPDGALMPASYVNFYIGNNAVIVPTYGVDTDAEALRLLSECFPDRETLGVSALALLQGGGAFHCITQQQPRPDAGQEQLNEPTQKV